MPSVDDDKLKRDFSLLFIYILLRSSVSIQKRKRKRNERKKYVRAGVEMSHRNKRYACIPWTSTFADSVRETANFSEMVCTLATAGWARTLTVHLLKRLKNLFLSFFFFISFISILFFCFWKATIPHVLDELASNESIENHGQIWKENHAFLLFLYPLFFLLSLSPSLSSSLLWNWIFFFFLIFDKWRVFEYLLFPFSYVAFSLSVSSHLTYVSPQHGCMHTRLNTHTRTYTHAHTADTDT